MEDWDDEDQFGPSADSLEQEYTMSKSRVVVLKHMFTLQELDEDPTLLLDLKEDVREECSNLGEVTNVVLYDVRPPFLSSAWSHGISCSERTRRCDDS